MILNMNPHCSLMPWNTKDFAPSIWHKMYVNSLRTVQSAYSRSNDDVMICYGKIITTFK